MWCALEVQWLARHLALHRGHAVIGTDQQLEHDGRAFERRAGTPGETRRSRDTLRGRTRHTEERDQRHDRRDNAASHHDHRRDEQQRRQEKWRPGHSSSSEAADRRGEHLREQHWRDHARDPHHTGDRTLQPALLVRPHAPGHQPLQRGIGEPEKPADGNAEQKQCPGRRQAVQRERDRAERQAHDQCSGLAQPPHRRPDQPTLHDHRHDADARQREPDGARRPAEAIVAVQYEQAWERVMRHAI